MRKARVQLGFFLGLAATACGREAAPVGPDSVPIPAGSYRLGSDAAERAAGYELSPPDVGQARWYDAWERAPYTVRLAAFGIDRTPVTQRAYSAFVRATRRPPPFISETEYRAQGFLVHPYTEVAPFLWRAGGPDSALLEHPVVLVTHEDARAYCAWRGKRLPTEEEWEATCRGPEGRRFPWGDAWRPDAAHVDTTFTAPVTAHPAGATPRGVRDLAGNVFEWTSSDFGGGRATLKGCSWDDAPGTCRCAFRHGRPPASRHILIGFRCAAP